MLAEPDRPAFYALARGGVRRDILTLLHPPYTLMHLSYFALGAAAAPHLYGQRLLWGLIAFLLGVGVSAHALDELNGRPLSTGFSDPVLVTLATISLCGALAIGIVGALSISLSLVPLVVIGGFLVLAYNLELFGGRMHSDLWFAIAGGGFPAFTGYFANARSMSLAGVLISLACLCLSYVQRRLSVPARELRRRTVSVSGERLRSDGGREELSVAVLLAPLEGALSALSLAVALTATALVAARL
jgi:hypothetical protein